MENANSIQKLAIDSFSNVLINCDINELKRLIDNNLLLIHQPYSKVAIDYIIYFKKMPFIGEYLKRNIDLDKKSIMDLIKSKNKEVYNLLESEKGKIWFDRQHKCFIEIIK